MAYNLSLIVLRQSKKRQKHTGQATPAAKAFVPDGCGDYIFHRFHAAMSACRYGLNIKCELLCVKANAGAGCAVGGLQEAALNFVEKNGALNNDR
jgi:hypothetical protein